MKSVFVLNFASFVQTILNKDAELVENREKLKNEFDKKIRSIQKEIDLNDEYKGRLRQLENDLKDQRFNDHHKIRELESQIKDLENRLFQREEEISKLKREEDQRLHFLRTAIIDYIGTEASS